MLFHEVITPEKVPFTYRVAGVGSRFLAWVLDVLIIVGFFLMGALLLGTFNVAREGLGTGLIMLWVFCLNWGYFLLFEWLWHGQTPGKRALGIRVIQERGTSLSFFQSAVRNVLRVVDSLPVAYGLGFFVAACNRENRRLGDLAAGTLVVHLHQQARPIRAVHDGNKETDRVHEALVRQKMEQLDRRQKQTILDVCLRRDQMSVPDRSRQFAAIAGYFENRLGLVPQEFQSDEKFVLQLAAILSSASRTAKAQTRNKAVTLPETAIPM